MKKLLVIGILALSAASFANTAQHVHTPAEHNVGSTAAGEHAQHKMDGGMGCMESPEMKKMMEEKGMMKDGKCMMMEMMMKGHEGHNSQSTDTTKKN